MNEEKDKITIRIPERAKDRIIYILSSSELFGFFYKGKLWIKTKSCNLCGKCCIVQKTWFLGIKKGSNVGWSTNIWICKYLEKEVWSFDEYKNQTVYICKNPHPPLKCVAGPIINFNNKTISPLECCLKFEKVK